MTRTTLLRCTPPHQLGDLVLQLRELALRFPALLQVEVRAGVERFDGNFFPALAGEEDERHVRGLFPEDF